MQVQRVQQQGLDEVRFMGQNRRPLLLQLPHGVNGVECRAFQLLRVEAGYRAGRRESAVERLGMTAGHGQSG